MVNSKEAKESMSKTKKEYIFTIAQKKTMPDEEAFAKIVKRKRQQMIWKK